jgi:hypothetical protein
MPGVMNGLVFVAQIHGQAATFADNVIRVVNNS